MPIATRSTRSARAALAACLVVAALLATLPAPVSALEPPRPLPAYQPGFVTETDTRPWTDCLWASGAMLLDKWTNGEVKVTRQALRAASGDHVGGSSFDEMRIAFAKHDFDLRFSPDGGTKTTWGQMLYRLERGAGAVLLGDYSKLPRWYGRWDYAFWKKEGAEDNHAVYIERYDRARGRVWLMDPLGRDGYTGEWISTRSLRQYAWSNGGAIYVAMTPTAKAAPFAGVRASKPRIVLSPTSVDAQWTLKVPKTWRFPGADVRTQFSPAADPIRAAAESPALPMKYDDTEAPTEGRATVVGKTLHVTAPLPQEPGAWTARLSLRDRRFGDTFVRSGKAVVFVPGTRRATLRLNVREGRVEAGSAINVSVNVANTGLETWADTPEPVTAGLEETVVRSTRVVAHWVPLDVPVPLDGDATARADGSLEAAGPGVAPAVAVSGEATTPLAASLGDGAPAAADAAAAGEPQPVLLRLVPLGPGQMVVVGASLVVPELPGRWALVVDVVDDIAGSFAALGSAPVVEVIDVVPARGIQPAE